MADIPADHPAVTVPQQVLANRSQLLASAAAVNPGVKGGVQTAAAASTRNAQEVMLEKLYPNDKNMTKVEVEPYSGNPNKLVNIYLPADNICVLPEFRSALCVIGIHITLPEYYFC